jgi:hypothetical protein
LRFTRTLFLLHYLPVYSSILCHCKAVPLGLGHVVALKVPADNNAISSLSPAKSMENSPELELLPGMHVLSPSGDLRTREVAPPMTMTTVAVP